MVRVDLAYHNLPVTLIGMGSGLIYSTLGGSHQSIEDISIAASLPNMNVICPADPYEMEKVVEWCKTKKVYIAGLNGDSNKNLFGNLYKLISHADEIIFLKALCKICKDGTLAIFSKKMVDNQMQVEIGGVELYYPVCRDHMNLE
jgi:thymidine kinase